jgi:thiol-disulfide isomerase/thioredoxin
MLEQCGCQAAGRPNAPFLVIFGRVPQSRWNRLYEPATKLYEREAGMTGVKGQGWLLGAAAALMLSAAGARAGDSPAQLNLKDLAGHRVRLSDYASKLVVLNFWATWCGPCQAEMPLLARIGREYAARGVVVIGVSVDDGRTRKDVKGFVARHDVDFPIWLGGTPDEVDKLKLGVAIPATAFLDRAGRVQARILGEVREAEVRERLDWLLGDRKGPAPAPLVNHLGH